MINILADSEVTPSGCYIMNLQRCALIGHNQIPQDMQSACLQGHGEREISHKSVSLMNLT